MTTKDLKDFTLAELRAHVASLEKAERKAKKAAKPKKLKRPKEPKEPLKTIQHKFCVETSMTYDGVSLHELWMKAVSYTVDNQLAALTEDPLGFVGGCITDLKKISLETSSSDAWYPSDVTTYDLMLSWEELNPRHAEQYVTYLEQLAEYKKALAEYELAQDLNKPKGK